MISKSEFVKIINNIKDYHEKEEKLTKYLHEFFMNGHSVVDFGSELIYTIVKLLAKNISEKYETPLKVTINWFIYENDFGKNKLSIYDILKDGTQKEYKITSVEKLYAHIVAYLKERNTDKE